MNIVYSSAGLIFGICIVTSLIMLSIKNELLRYVTIFVIGLFIIYIIFLIVSFFKIDLKVFYVIICYIIVLIIFIFLYMIIENTAYRKIIIINGIGLCLAFYISLSIPITEWRYDDFYRYYYILVLLTVCTIMGCILSKEVWLSTIVGVILFCTIIDVAYMYNGKERYIFSVISYVFGCFSLIYAFFGNIYVSNVLCYICYSLILFSLSHDIDGRQIFPWPGGVLNGFYFCVTACIVVNMDYAKWIEVIIWIIFGILALGSYSYLLILFIYDD